MPQRQCCTWQARGRRSSAADKALDRHNFNCQSRGWQCFYNLPTSAQYFVLRETQHIHDGNRIKPIVEIIHQRCFQRSISQLVYAEGSEEWIGAYAFNQVISANEQPALRASEELVSARSDQVRAEAEAVDESRLEAYAELIQGKNETRALVIKYRDALARAK